MRVRAVCVCVQRAESQRDPTFSFSALVQCRGQLWHTHAAVDHHEAFLFRSHSVLQRPTEGISVSCNEYLWLDGARFCAPCVKRRPRAVRRFPGAPSRPDGGGDQPLRGFYWRFNNTSVTQWFNYLPVI